MVTTFEAPTDERPIASLGRRLQSRLDARAPRPIQVALLGLALVAGTCAARAWLTWGSWFAYHDYGFLYEQRTGTEGSSRAMPLARILIADSVAHDGGWLSAAVQMIALSVLAGLACLWMLCVVFGTRAWVLLPLGWYLLTPFTLPATVSWSSAIHQWPLHIFAFTTIACFTLWLRHRTLRTLLATAIAYAAALISEPKAIGVLVIAGFLALTVPAPPREDTGRWFQRHGGVWTVLTVLTLVAGVWLWTTSRIVNVLTDSPDIGTLGDMVRVIAPALTGGPWAWTDGVPPHGYPGTAIALVGATCLALTLLIAFRLRRRPESAAVLLLFAVGLLASVGGTAASPPVAPGPTTLRDIAMYPDVPVLAVFCLAALLLPRSPRAVDTNPDAPTGDPMARSLTVIVIVIAVAGAAVTTLTYTAPWQATDDAEQFPERVFVNAVGDAAERYPEDVSVLDTTIPGWISDPARYPDNRLSRYATLATPAMNVESTGNNLTVLGLDFRLSTATNSGVVRNDPGPVEDCGYLVDDGPLTIPVAAPPEGYWWVSVNYLASGAGGVEVVTADGRDTFDVESGPNVLWFNTDSRIEAIAFETLDDQILCVDEIRIGQPLPHIEIEPR